jgi:hypothetical protein
MSCKRPKSEGEPVLDGERYLGNGRDPPRGKLKDDI